MIIATHIRILVGLFMFGSSPLRNWNRLDWGGASWDLRPIVAMLLYGAQTDVVFS